MDVSSSQEIPRYSIPTITESEFPAAIPLAPDAPTEEVDVHWIYDALIDNIVRDGSVYYVTISYMEPGTNTAQRILTMELVVSDQITRVFDQKKRPVLLKSLTRGMTIDALVSSRMSNSLPPKAQAYQILISAPPLDRTVTEGEILQVNVRNDFLLIAPDYDTEQILRINIVSDTVIMNMSGRIVAFRDLTPEISVWVEHEPFFTGSNPPQATAAIIQILG